MLGRRFGKVQQLLADEIIECRLQSVTVLNGASGLALLNPDFVQLAGLSHSEASKIRRFPLAVGFCISQSRSFDHRRRPETFRTAIATAFF